MIGSRRGITQIELTMATVLLTATLATILSYRRQSQMGLTAAQSASLAQTRTVNLRRELSSWPFDQIQQQSIEELSPAESNLLPAARWSAEVTEIDQPIVGKQVVLALRWREGERERLGPSLTFWVKRP